MRWNVSPSKKRLRARPANDAVVFGALRTASRMRIVPQFVRMTARCVRLRFRRLRERRRSGSLAGCGAATALHPSRLERGCTAALVVVAGVVAVVAVVSLTPAFSSSSPHPTSTRQASRITMRTLARRTGASVVTRIAA
jgi:hypothetical protein